MRLETINLPDVAVLLFLALGTASLALIVMARFTRDSATETSREQIQDTAFLFDGTDLVDSTPAARRLLDVTDTGESDLSRLTRFLAPRFPDLYANLQDLKQAVEVELKSTDNLSSMRMRKRDNQLRILIEDTAQDAPFYAPDRHCLTAIFEELQMHRGLANGAKFPMWRQTTDGKILWTNEAYRRLETALGMVRRDSGYPNRIFKDELNVSVECKHVQRASIELPHEADPKWFEFEISLVEEDLLVAAIPVDRIVRAERSLNGFIQTLTQTFAHLNVGLAVFTRTRELAIFNPALADLLDLSPEFLVTRPTLFNVFDRLREQRMVPEPKDYKSWRRKMSALEAAATDSAFSETWTLVDGRTFRVTGRPHPEGAVAFLFEDISDEISLVRKFRSELQMGHAVIDGLDEAIAVYAPSGVLVFSNRAYAKLWFDQEELKSETTTFVESTRQWQHSCAPTPVWGDARDFAATMGERVNWTAEVRQRDGKKLSCRFDTLAGGYTLVGFTSIAASVEKHAPKTPKKLSA